MSPTLSPREMSSIDNLMESGTPIEHIANTFGANSEKRILAEEYIQEQLISDSEKVHIEQCIEYDVPVNEITDLLMSQRPEDANVRMAIKQYAVQYQARQGKSRKEGQQGFASPSSFNRQEFTGPSSFNITAPDQTGVRDFALREHN